MHSDDRKSQLYLCCASLPPTISRVSFRYELGFEELGITHSHFEQFAEDETTIGWANIKKPRWTDLIALNQLTFTVTLNLIDIYAAIPNEMTERSHCLLSQYLSPIECAQCVVTQFIHQHCGSTLPSPVMDCMTRFVDGMVMKQWRVCQHEYQWTISDSASVLKLKSAENGSIFRGHLFEIDGFKFLMQICPNGSNPLRKGCFNWYCAA